IDGALHLLAAGAHGGEVVGSGLHHLGEPVEHLASVVRGRRGPAGEGAARRLDRIPCVLPRRPRDVLALRLVGAAGLGARERAAHVELVRLSDRKAAHAITFTTAATVAPTTSAKTSQSNTARGSRRHERGGPSKSRSFIRCVIRTSD